jgi:hypothetical protein
VRGTVRDGPASENHRNFRPRRTTRERLRSAGVVEPNIVSQQVVSAQSDPETTGRLHYVKALDVKALAGVGSLQKSPVRIDPNIAFAATAS